MDFCRLIACLFVLNACLPDKQPKSPTQEKPNIIYILVDDLGFGDLSCYGQETLKTPYIDALASSGMRFTQHYAGATVCAPSRASLLTGKQPGRSSVRGNGPVGQILDPAETTFAEALQTAGYTTAIIGKWGVGNGMQADDPIQNGFDEAYGYINMWHAHNFFPEFLYQNGERVVLTGNELDTTLTYWEGMPEGTGVAQNKQTYVLEEFESEALRFIQVNQDGPFMLYLALNMPHANNEAGQLLGDGMEVPHELVRGQWVPQYGQWEEKQWPQPEKGFARMMELIDLTVGKIEAKLAELELAENTVIMFASDNGPHQEGRHSMEFFNSNGELRGMKRDLYEGGIRVPFIVKWPGKVQPGSKSDHISAFWDVLPTLCDMVGSPVPKGVDGISFLPTLLGQPQAEHPYLYWEFYEQGGKQAIRAGDWKYVKLNVRDPEKPIQRELYNLSKDLLESRNIVEDHPEIVRRMENRLREGHEPHPMFSLFPYE